jgi:carbon monoxide dehydrogenase subunit G
LDFNGSFEVNVPADYALRRLTDIKWISDCLPMLTELKTLNENEFDATFKVDVSEAASKLHIEYLSNVTVKMKFKFLKKELQHVVLEGSGRVVGSTLKIMIEFTIENRAEKTVIPWKGHVDFGLLLKFFGQKLIVETANGIIDSIIKCISDKLNRAYKNGSSHQAI